MQKSVISYPLSTLFIFLQQSPALRHSREAGDFLQVGRDLPCQVFF